jgi:hypothetical protein
MQLYYVSSSLCVQTKAKAHLASYPISTGFFPPGVKRGRGVTLTTHSIYSAAVKNE